MKRLLIMRLILSKERQEGLYKQCKHLQFVEEAVITVYFAFILPIILSLLAVSIQSAAISLSEIQMERILRQAMLSELAEYHRVLYDEFHIFGLCIEKEGLKIEELEDKTSAWVRENTTENEGLLLSNAFLSKLQVTEFKTLMTDLGEPFQRQVIDYMQYQEVESLIEWLLSKAGLVHELEQTESLLEKKVQITEQFAKIDRKLQQLMRWIDGVLIEDGKLERTWKGNIKTEKTFTKKLVFGVFDAKKLGINHLGLFEALRENYMDPTKKLEEMKNAAEQYEKLQNKMQEKNASLDRVRQERKIREEQQKQLEEVLNEQEEKTQLKQLKLEQEQLEQEIQKMLSQASQEQKRYKAAIQKLTDLEEECKKSNEYALRVIEEIKQSQEDILKEIVVFETILQENREGNEELVQELERELKQEKDMGIDFSELEKQLLEQRKVLQRMSKVLFPKLENYISQPDSLEDSINQKKELYKTYAAIIPKLDYRGLREDKGEKIEWLDTVQSLISKEVLIEDLNSLSKEEIKQDYLPTVICGISGQESFFHQILEVIKKNTLSELFSFSESYDLYEKLSDTAEYVLNRVRILSYCEEHFGRYHEERKNHKLAYELEYLLFGDRVDKNNLQKTVNKIFSWRVLLNIVSLFTNRSCIEKANRVAVTAVGFTGFSGLVCLTKYLILTVWAMAAAMIETAAITQNKRISFLPKNAPVIDITELPTLTKKEIQRRAKQVTQDSSGFTYLDYLRIFLILQPLNTTNLRAMDLIQETIRCYYDPNFYIQHCIDTYRTKMECVLPLYLFSMPWLGNAVEGKNYLYEISLEVSY